MTSRFIAHGEQALREAAQLSVDHARRLGADGSSAYATSGGGMRIVVRDGAAETAQRDGFQALDCTVYRNGAGGSASTMALDPDSIRRATEEALTIATHVQPDPFGGLADPDVLAHEGPQPPMFAPVEMEPDELLDMAMSIEAVAAGQPHPAQTDLRVAEAGVAVGDSAFALATSAGFCRSAIMSSHGRWAVMLAERSGSAVRGYEQTSERRIADLMPVHDLAAGAVERTVALLGARTLSSRRSPVLFDARVASALIGDLVTALSGGPQYRRASFLLDAIDTAVAADHLDLIENPFIPFGMASGAFDAEGVAGSRREILCGGVVRGYFLGTESARRLGRRSTGNAGGAWNLELTSRNPVGGMTALRRRMGTGLVVTGLLGGATDPVSGNWTRAVEGLWIENGEVFHPVQDVTVGGRMGSMLKEIVAVGTDVRRSGGFATGSILIEDMQIGGAA